MSIINILWFGDSQSSSEHANPVPQFLHFNSIFYKYFMIYTMEQLFHCLWVILQILWRHRPSVCGPGDNSSCPARDRRSIAYRPLPSTESHRRRLSKLASAQTRWASEHLKDNRIVIYWSNDDNIHIKTGFFSLLHVHLINIYTNTSKEVTHQSTLKI